MSISFLRRGVLLSLALTLGTSAHAQSTTPTLRTLTDGAQTIRAIGGADARVSRIAGTTTALTGGRAGILVNGTTSVAIAARANLNQNISTGYRLTDGRQAGLSFGYGGIEIGRRFAPQRRVHLSSTLLLGGGAVGYHDRRWRAGSDDALPVDGFWLAEPELQVEANATRFLRVAVGGSYRYVHGARLASVTDRDVRGAAGALTLSFGRF